MTLLRYMLCFGIFCIGISACKKKEGENQNIDPSNLTAFDFMSSKEGSTWRYGVKDGVSYTRYARGRDSVKMGITYRYYERKDDNAGSFQPEYFGKNGTSYLTLIDIDGNENNYINYLFWKDGAAVGTSWDNTGSVSSPLGNVYILIESYIAENNLTMTIGSHTYTNVVHVHSNLKGGALNTSIGTLDGWMVKGIGVIREEANIDILGQYQTKHTDSLLDYHIVP